MFEHKELVYAFYKERSFSKAAAKMLISQSTLSLMVKKAEKISGLLYLIENLILYL